MLPFSFFLFKSAHRSMVNVIRVVDIDHTFSRARHGLIAMGNFDLLAEKSKLWKEVVMAAKSTGIFGSELHLVCHNHPEDEGVRAVSAEDFTRVPEGGCMKPCEYRLKCGHVCPKVTLRGSIYVRLFKHFRDPGIL